VNIFTNGKGKMNKEANTKINLTMATSLVISSMVGTGIFTSLGFQVVDLESTLTIVLLWLLGGVIAFCGAVCYAELGAAFPRSGGEYQLLTKLYHPVLGFLAGWVSVTVGFAAPAAIAALALSAYMGAIIDGLPQQLFAAIIVVAISALHATSLRMGSQFHTLFTFIKVILMVAFVGFAIIATDQNYLNFQFNQQVIDETLSRQFGIALVFVLYAYTGWNSSIYVVGDIENPKKNLPKSILLATLLVAVCYIAINIAFLYVVPIDELKGQIEIGSIAGKYLFGPYGSKVIAGMICILLLSTVSAYIFLGPRVTHEMVMDMPALGFLKDKNNANTTHSSFAFSAVLALFFIYSGTFDQVLVYTSFLLILITTLTVAGLFILRLSKKFPNASYRAWGYPITPLFFILTNIWVLFYIFLDRPYESLIGTCILFLGICIFYFTLQRNNAA
jgi:APA family basic amino acid/polyamine antiporter